MNNHQYTQSLELFDRATKVIPGGIYGSKSPGFVVPGAFPYFFTHGKGSRLWDADGNEFIDFMCGYGSQLLGYGNPEIDQPAIEQLQKGDLLTNPSPVMVELAERMTDQIEGMNWAVFSKNGTDSTTLALSLSRVVTGKKKYIVARGAYHGSANWCSSNDYPELEDKKDILYFDYNNLDELRMIFQKYKGQIAGIMLTPFHHPAFKDLEMPEKGFFDAVEKMCKDEKAVFTMDDIRANFRLSMKGSHAYFGAHPHLVTMGKAVANGYAMSALLGTEELRSAADSFFITGTYWTAAVSMVASLKCLDIMAREPVLEHINRLGKALAEGLIEAGSRHGYEILMTGPPSIPFMRFKKDPDLYLNQQFCGEMTRRGVYLHPHHNWFLSYAHNQGDIEETLEKADRVFKLMREGKSDI